MNEVKNFRVPYLVQLFKKTLPSPEFFYISVRPRLVNYTTQTKGRIPKNVWIVPFRESGTEFQIFDSKC